ncbi:MAG: hypothetical protein APR62_13530 [Smithella sp. SDB]|nr:MAG: hypothetical protein APR62_13530 [Smithella sp. SDB]
MKNTEKRRSIRRKGKFPVVIDNGRGITRDFSSSGIFFETDKSFTPGQSIDFTIVLEYVDPDRPVYLKCRGSIVRVEDKGKKLGIAATINSYTFDRSDSINARQAKKRTRKDIKF